MSVSPRRVLRREPIRVDLVPGGCPRSMGTRSSSSRLPTSLDSRRGWIPEAVQGQGADQITDLYVLCGSLSTSTRTRSIRSFFYLSRPDHGVRPKDFNPRIFLLPPFPVDSSSSISATGRRAQRSKCTAPLGTATSGISPWKTTGMPSNRWPICIRHRSGTGRRHGRVGRRFQSATLMFSYPDFFSLRFVGGAHDMNILESYWSELNHGVKEFRIRKDTFRK